MSIATNVTHSLMQFRTDWTEDDWADAVGKACDVGELIWKSGKGFWAYTQRLATHGPLSYAEWEGIQAKTKELKCATHGDVTIHHWRPKDDPGPFWRCVKCAAPHMGKRGGLFVPHPEGGEPFAECFKGCNHMDDGVHHYPGCPTVARWERALATGEGPQ